MNIEHLHINPETNIFITGQTGRGKTLLMKQIIEKIKSFKTHAIVITDINNEYPADFEIYSLDDFNEYRNDEKHLLQGKVYSLKFGESITHYEKAISILHQEFAFFYLVVEEASVLTKPNYIHHDFQSLVALHRHNNKAYTVISQRPAMCARVLTSQVNLYITFLISEPLDIDWLKKKGFHPEKVLNLQKPIFKNGKLIHLDYDFIDLR